MLSGRKPFFFLSFSFKNPTIRFLFFQMNSRHTHFPQLSGPRRQELAFEPTARPGGASASEWRGKTGHAIPRREILIEEKIQAMVNFVKIGHFSRE